MDKFKQISIFALIFASGLLAVPANFTLADRLLTQSSNDAQKTQLQQELDAIEREIAQYEQELSGVQSQKNTLSNKIKQLQTQKNKITAQIRATNLNIQNINEQISDTQTDIQAAQERIGLLRSHVANLLPDIYEQDQQSAIEMLLGNDGLIGFYQQLDAYERINKNLKDLLDQLDEESKDLRAQQIQLEEQEEEQRGMLVIASMQNTQLAENIGEQNTLLAETRGQEANYQATLSDKRKQAAAVRSRIYELFGNTAGKQVTFGEAVEIAKGVSAMTGVRAAFLLSVLTQESNLGKNVGTCNRAGDPPSKSYKVVMKPDRDIKPFLQITADLGMDPETTPVSCPMFQRGKQVGYGGAMGPAQFIPSTWMGYKDKVAALTGKTANPWDIRDAFLAAGLKLKAGGAGTVSGEWAAAMRYFSGGTNTRYRFYGDSVVARANRYQADIDALNE